MTFSAREFLTTEVGDAQSVLSLFTLRGVLSIGIDTIRKWYERDSLPGDKLVTLLAILEIDRGEPVSVVKYIF